MRCLARTAPENPPWQVPRRRPPAEKGEIFTGHAGDFRHPSKRAAGGGDHLPGILAGPIADCRRELFLGLPAACPVDRLDSDAAGTDAVLSGSPWTIDPEEIVRSLSVAEQQLVEIAKAISLNSTLLIMDEPTAALGLVETERLMELIRRLTAQNKGDPLYFASPGRSLRDRRPGDHLERRPARASPPVSKLKMGDVVRRMVGFDIEQHYPKQSNARRTSCLQVENLTTENGVTDVSFTMHVGEVFGLGGMLGSGRSEIARAIYGLDNITSGRFAWRARKSGFALRRSDRRRDRTGPRKPQDGRLLLQLRRSTEYHDLAPEGRAAQAVLSLSREAKIGAVTSRS